MLKALRNALDFPLRRLLRWRRPLTLKPGSKTDLFADRPPERRIAAARRMEQLVSAYQLQDWYQRSPADVWLETLFYLEMLEQAFSGAGAGFGPELAIADVGCSDWFYAPVLLAFAHRYGAPGARQVSLQGFEIDPWRVYRDLHSRYDYAMAYTNGLGGTEYVPADFGARQQQAPRQYGLVTMLFPFLFPHDHLDWGLPAPLLRPSSLLATAWDSLAPGGWLFVANCGADEHRYQQQLLAEVGISVAWSGEHRSDFWQYPRPRWSALARHP